MGSITATCFVIIDLGHSCLQRYGDFVRTHEIPCGFCVAQSWHLSCRTVKSVSFIMLEIDYTKAAQDIPGSRHAE